MLLVLLHRILVLRVLNRLLCWFVRHYHLLFVIFLQEFICLLRRKLHNLLMRLLIHHWGLLLNVIKDKLVAFEIYLLCFVEVRLTVSQDRSWIALHKWVGQEEGLWRLWNWVEGIKCWLVLILSSELCSLEINESLLERSHYVLASYISIKFLFILLYFLLVKRLKSYDRTAHNIRLLLVIINVISYLVEPYASRSGCSHWRSISKEELSVISSS